MNDNAKMKFNESEFVKDFLKVYAANGGSKSEDEMLKRTVGNNGYTIGQQFTLTGKIEIKENTINGVKQTYIVLPTKEGVELSLMSLMGVSSLKGYDLENEVTIEYGTKQNTKTRTTKSELLEDFDFTMCFQPPTRNFLEFVGMIAEGAYDLTGKTATYLGTAVKPTVSKKKGEMNGEKFDAEMKRAIETKLWSIE